MEKESLYVKLKAAGVPVETHASDLWVPISDASRAIVEKYEYFQNVTVFWSERDQDFFYDVPFGFAPYFSNCKLPN
jgi:hypothetical protein